MSGVALGLGVGAVRLIPLQTGRLPLVHALMITFVLPAVAHTVHVDSVEDGVPAALLVF